MKLPDLTALVREILGKMRDRTGSVTLHFKNGTLKRVEYRTFGEPPGEKSA